MNIIKNNERLIKFWNKTLKKLNQKEGALTIEMVIIIIIVVVLGALFLNWVLQLFGVDILPMATEKIKALFDFTP